MFNAIQYNQSQFNSSLIDFIAGVLLVNFYIEKTKPVLNINKDITKINLYAGA